MTTEQKVTRKLRAILSADVKGYSTLMTNDEVSTIQTLKEYRNIMSGIINEHSGNVVDMPGDNIMAEFSSVVNAVKSAVAIQKALKSKNDALPNEKRLEFRIGINIGDVVQDGNSLYGEGVNIAARIEGLADPGGICISRGAYDHIRNKLNFGYEYIGEHTVKNIKNPVRVYKVLMGSEDAGKVIGEGLKPSVKKLAWTAVIAVIIVFLVMGYQFYQQLIPPGFEPASIKKMAYPLPVKPSIAVLPFNNMSNDPNQEYLCDGITNQVITSLSRSPYLFVIARNSTFFYKGKNIKINEIAENLGIRYVLEGSVQRDENYVRITVQLIDATTGQQIWADNYDRELSNIFVLQDEIALKIMAELHIELSTLSLGKLYSIKTKSIKAYEKYLKGIDHIWSRTVDDNLEARKLAQEAIDIDPEYGAAYLMLGYTHLDDVWFYRSKDRAKSLETAEKLAHKAIEHSGEDALTHRLLSTVFLLRRQYEKAIKEIQKAIEMEPNSAQCHFTYGMILRLAERFNEAIPVLEKAIRLNPIAPINYLNNLAFAYAFSEDYEKAILLWKKTIERNPDYLFAHMGLTTVYQLIGKEDIAREMAKEILRIRPDFSVARVEKSSPIKDPKRKKKWTDALRKAGLPENPPLPLPDKPSIAVLAFDNMSGDPEQEYFSDGLSESIISTLSKIDQLFVIARNSSFTYKGKTVKVQQIARDLGVRYVLEGSVQKSEDRIRITAQLIDAVAGNHVWSERYDGNLTDIFNLQDEIVRKIVTALQIKLAHGEQVRYQMKEFTNFHAYLKYLEAISEYVKGTRESWMRYGQLAQEIIDLEPESPGGYRLLGTYHQGLAGKGFSSRENLKKAFSLAQKALSMDENDSYTHTLMCQIYTAIKEHEKAISTGKQAVKLSPSSGMAHILLAIALCYAEEYDQAIIQCKQGIRLNPLPIVYHFSTLAQCFYSSGLYEKALTELKKAVKLSPDYGPAHVRLAVVYGLLDRKEEAQASAKKALEIYPNWSVSFFKNNWKYKTNKNLPKFIDAMRKAGFPE